MAALAKDSIVNKPSLIEFKNLRFLIMDAPKESNLHLYLRECKKYNVVHIVRISEPSYNKEEVESAGITLHVSGAWQVPSLVFQELIDR
jgi:protein tyrosine phosphatase type 4A